MGPLVSQVQLERVTQYYEQGIAQGAQPIVDFQRPTIEGNQGYYVSPHLLTGSEDNVCYREEVFGPTAYVLKYKDEQEAIERTNNLSYGLANSVWSSDMEKAQSISEQIVAGNSWINAHNVFAYGLPYGGINLSGVGGGVNSPETFNDYLRNKTIARPLE